MHSMIVYSNVQIIQNKLCYSLCH